MTDRREMVSYRPIPASPPRSNIAERIPADRIMAEERVPEWLTA